MRNPDERIGSGDDRLDAAALELVDTNGDGAAGRAELVDALVRGTVRASGEKLVPVQPVRLPRPPVTTPDQYGLRGRPWMQDTFIPGGNPSKPPRPVAIEESPASYSPESDRFADVAALVKTPEQVTAFLKGSGGVNIDGLDLRSGNLDFAAINGEGANISYDQRRQRNTASLGDFSAYSSTELLVKGKGVCRDQHALARDLLITNGYKAELLGYLATNQIHAVTAYQDPQTGYWGIIEYDTFYPAEELKARTSEEALLRFRPATLVIVHYENNGPQHRSTVDGLIYLPATRLFQSFMAGPAPGAGTTITGSNSGTTITADLSRDGSWQAGVQVVTDPRMPHLQGGVMVGVWKTFPDAGVRIGAGGGVIPTNVEHKILSNKADKHVTGVGFASAEELHPDILSWENIGGSGVKIGVSSHAWLQLLAAIDKYGFDAGMSLGLSSLKWNPDITAERWFAVWNRDKPDTRLYATYGLGVDGGLLFSHYNSGGRSLPLNQYVVGGIDTRPLSWMGISVQGYVPITNHTNDFAASPLGRVELSFPYIRIGTTQGKDIGRYDAAAGVKWGCVDVGAFCGIEEDRRNHEVAPIVGGQIRVTF